MRTITTWQPGRADGRGVDAWTLLTGGSVGIVVGFAADLWRLGLDGLRRSAARRRTHCDHCSAAAR